jgi:cytosine/adenosine deaminase-related metal-dependent hydrolase
VPVLAGRILLESEAPEGWVAAENGVVVATGTGAPPEPATSTGWIVPAPANAHTHMADAFLRDVPGKPAGLAELVGPGGWKQQRLAAAKEEEMRAGVERYAAEMAAVGVARILDFREGGLDGVRMMRRWAPKLRIPVTVFGRPKTPGFDLYEAEDILKEADGIGLSALRDFARPRHAREWADLCHEKRKPLALHASEAAREDAEEILTLEPAFLVHCTQASPRDLAAIAGDGVPVVVCPRSNAHYGMKTPLPQLLDAGLRVAVGTDNGMLNDGNVLAELAQLQAWHPQVPVDVLLRLATWNARALAGLRTRPPRKGEPADWIVLPEKPWAPAPAGKPRMAVRG